MAPPDNPRHSTRIKRGRGRARKVDQIAELCSASPKRQGDTFLIEGERGQISWGQKKRKVSPRSLSFSTLRTGETGKGEDRLLGKKENPVRKVFLSSTGKAATGSVGRKAAGIKVLCPSAGKGKGYERASGEPFRGCR